jgi:hypothetical protein
LTLLTTSLFLLYYTIENERAILYVKHGSTQKRSSGEKIMKKFQRALFPFVVLLTILFAGCDQSQTTDPDDSKTANEKSTQAYTEMENLFASPGDITGKNFSNVEKLYMDAVAADPTNATANFGAAFAHMLAAMSDTAIKNTMDRWEDVPLNTSSSLLKFGIPSGTSDMMLPTQALSANLVKIIRTATSDPPTITEMQNLMRDRVLPRINYAIARLAVVERNSSFELRISGKMQGNANKKDLYLDLTEVYIMEAMLYGMKSAAEQFLVFKFELASYTTKAMVPALRQNSTTFFVLASDGAARAQNVKASLVGAVEKIRGGMTFLKNETDDQDNDIIKRGNDGLSTSDIDTMLVYLDKIQTALTGTFTVDLKDADTENNDYTVSVSLNNFFNNMPQNPKSAWFPAYTVDSTVHGDLQIRFQAQDYASFTFPDPTFSGLFPGMTNATLKRLLYIDEEFAWKVNVSVMENYMYVSNASVTLTINGTTYLPKTVDPRGDAEFLIMDNNSQPVQSITVSKSGVNIPVEFAGDVPVVTLKDRSYISVDLTRAPQNITATYNSNPRAVILNLQSYASYDVERSVNSGAFVKIGSIYGYQYSDNSVSAATSYSYRVKLGMNYYYGYSVRRTNNYSNTVSLTTP